MGVCVSFPLIVPLLRGWPGLRLEGAPCSPLKGFWRGPSPPKPVQVDMVWPRGTIIRLGKALALQSYAITH